MIYNSLYYDRLINRIQIKSGEVDKNHFREIKMKNKYLNANEENAINLFTKKIRALLGEQLISIKMFGSKVRGDFSQESDIDILMIVRDKNKIQREKIYDILLDIDLKFDPKISLKIFTREEFDQNKKLGSPFVFNVEKQGISI